MSIHSKLKSLHRHYKKLWKKSNSIYLVTGADSSHYKSLFQFLSNLQLRIESDRRFKVIAWDLGLEKEQANSINEHFKDLVQLKKFPFDQYPEWLNIKVRAGEYAWKAQLIQLSLLSNHKLPDYLIWMDSGNLITESIEPLIDYLDQWLIYSPFARGTIGEWTYPATLEFLKNQIDPALVENFRIRNGACFGFQTKSSDVQKFISEFARLSLIRECIAPTGSSRENHRQDQSLFSILYYGFMQKHFGLNLMPKSDEYIGFTIHNDID